MAVHLLRRKSLQRHGLPFWRSSWLQRDAAAAHDEDHHRAVVLVSDI
jgi:hypothetical protein